MTVKCENCRFVVVGEKMAVGYTGTDGLIYRTPLLCKWLPPGRIMVLHDGWCAQHEPNE